MTDREHATRVNYPTNSVPLFNDVVSGAYPIPAIQNTFAGVSAYNALRLWAWQSNNTKKTGTHTLTHTHY